MAAAASFGMAGSPSRREQEAKGARQEIGGSVDFSRYDFDPVATGRLLSAKPPAYTRRRWKS